METGTSSAPIETEIRNLLLRVAELNGKKSKDAFPLIEHAFSLAQNYGEPLLLAEVFHAKAQYHCETINNFDASISLLEKAIEVAGDAAPPQFLIKVNVAIGINFYYKGKLDVALKYYVRGISIAEEENKKGAGKPWGLASLYYNVGTVFSNSEMYELRKEYFFKALNILKQHPNTLLEGRVLNGLGGVYLEEKKFDEALENLHVALHLAEKENDRTGIAVATNNIGLAHVEAGRHQEAIGFLLKGLSMKQQEGNKQTISQSYIHLGVCYNKCAKPRQAIRFLSLAIELLKEIGAEKLLAEAYLHIAESYASLGEYDKAYNHQVLYDKLRDELFSSNKANSINETISSFEISRNERETDALKSQAEKVKQLAERLERGNNELKQFTNLVAHDFKEPLRMIRGYIQLINKHLNGNLTQDETELIKAAEAGVKQMDLLLHSLMELAKLNAKPVFTQVDLNEILIQAKQNLSESIAEKNATIAADVLPIVQADYIQMVQLFQNLIGNALKYNQSEKPCVVISVHRLSNSVRIMFEDNGIGIAGEYREKVFELFQRLHSKYEYSGSGIGLSICKKIVDAVNGKIYIQDSCLGGANFVIELPR